MASKVAGQLQEVRHVSQFSQHAEVQEYSEANDVCSLQLPSGSSTTPALGLACRVTDGRQTNQKAKRSDRGESVHPHRMISE